MLWYSFLLEQLNLIINKNMYQWKENVLSEHCLCKKVRPKNIHCLLVKNLKNHIVLKEKQNKDENKYLLRPEKDVTNFSIH